MSSHAIGHVETASGEVLVTRSDGVQETLTEGSPVYQGDVVQTGPGASVGIIFIDETTFALDEDTRMVLDELIFDAQAEQGGAVFSVLQGVFTFATGKIVEDDPDNMIINTPVAMIGISGTSGGCHIDLGGDSICALFHGAVIISNAGGSVVLDVPFQATWITNFITAPGAPFILTPEMYDDIFGGAAGALPEQFGDLAPEAGPAAGAAGLAQGGTFRANGLLELDDLASNRIEGAGLGRGILGTGVAANELEPSFGLEESFGQQLDLGPGAAVGGAPPPPPPPPGGGGGPPPPVVEDIVLTNINPGSPVVVVIPAEALLANDAEGVTIVAVGDFVGGTVVIDADGNLVFTTSGETRAFEGSFTYTTDDGEKHLVSVTGTDGDTIIGTEADEIIIGDADDSFLMGGDGDDYIVGGDNLDEIDGGAGDDVVIWNFGGGGDSIDGGDDTDTLFVNGSDGVDLISIIDSPLPGPIPEFFVSVGTFPGGGGGIRDVLTRFFATADNLGISGIEHLVIDAGGGDDNLVIRDLSDTSLEDVTIIGGEGDDTVTITDFPGDDPMVLTVGKDLDSNVVVSGTIGGDDQPVLLISGVEELAILGSDGTDIVTIGDLSGTDLELISFTGGASADTLDASGQLDTGLSIVARGGDGEDVLTGGAGDDQLFGHDIVDDFTADTIRGGGGDDLIVGGSGDFLFGDAGDDIFRITFNFSSIPATIDGGDGLDILEVADDGMFLSDFATVLENVEVIDISAFEGGVPDLFIDAATVGNLGNENTDIPVVGDWGDSLQFVDLLVIGDGADDKATFLDSNWDLDTDNMNIEVAELGTTFDVWVHTSGGVIDAIVAVESELSAGALIP